MQFALPTPVTIALMMVSTSLVIVVSVIILTSMVLFIVHRRGIIDLKKWFEFLKDLGGKILEFLKDMIKKIQDLIGGGGT